MTVDEAAAILGKMYREAATDEKVVQIHLFAIRHANAIRNMSPTDIAIRAEIPKSYGAEINKGRNLARFVRPIET